MKVQRHEAKKVYKIKFKIFTKKECLEVIKKLNDLMKIIETVKLYYYGLLDIIYDDGRFTSKCSKIKHIWFPFSINAPYSYLTPGVSYKG